MSKHDEREVAVEKALKAIMSRVRLEERVRLVIDIDGVNILGWAKGAVTKFPTTYDLLSAPLVYDAAKAESEGMAAEKLPTVTLYFNGKPFETTLATMTGAEILEQAKSKGFVEQWQLHREGGGRLILVEELSNGTNRIIGRNDELGLGFTRKFSAIDGADNA